MAGDGGRGVFAEYTPAQKADGAIFQAFCESCNVPYLPADPKTIRAFIEDRMLAGKKPATVKRYVATIARAHIAAGLLNPCSSEAVRVGLKKMGREISARQNQAHPLRWKDIKEFVESAVEGLRADRERAMLCVAYETLARRGELVALEVKDIDFHPDGTGQALIRRGKTDAEGQGREQFIDSRIAAELRIAPERPSRWKRAKQWVKDHPIATTGIGTAIAMVTLVAKLLGWL